MAKDLHKGMTLDDKFNKILGRIQDSLEDLHKLAEDFKSQDHTSVMSQNTALLVTTEDMASARDKFQDLRLKSK